MSGTATLATKRYTVRRVEMTGDRCALWHVVDPDGELVASYADDDSGHRDAVTFAATRNAQGRSEGGDGGVLSNAMLDELVGVGRRDARDGCLVVPEDVEFLTCGVCVRDAGSEDGNGRSLVCCMVLIAWARSGMAYVCDAGYTTGLDWLLEKYLPLARVRLAVSGEILSLGGSWCGINATWNTTRVLEACRQRVYSTHGAMIRLMAIRYDPRAVDAVHPLVKAPEHKRRHPTRPGLGLVEYWYAHRHSWVDRTHRRCVEKRLRMLCSEPEDWRSHLNACFLSPVEKQHGWEPSRLEWEKPVGVRDDFARCIDFAEIAAAAQMGLDSIHTSKTLGVAQRAENQRATTSLTQVEPERVTMTSPAPAFQLHAGSGYAGMMSRIVAEFLRRSGGVVSRAFAAEALVVDHVRSLFDRAESLGLVDRVVTFEPTCLDRVYVGLKGRDADGVERAERFDVMSVPGVRAVLAGGLS